MKGEPSAANAGQEVKDGTMPHIFIASAQKQPTEMAQGDGMIAHHIDAYTPVPPKHQMDNDGDSVPDFDEMEKLNMVKAEFSKQLEETRKDLEEKLRTSKEEDGPFGMSARDLSLVPDLEIPAKFKAPEFEKFEGNTSQVSKVEGQEPSENENPAKEGEAMPMEDIEMTDAENAKGTAVKEDKVMPTEELEVSKAENGI
ncbi:hypothetical protein V6N11_029293 [Hibiscus sabdariffa]|uniref:Uncharacterized protein n=1 Tax=Hibiscus sabdariffa TaxID=183260 RepID=A0ABR1ZPQ2_9ROSI